MSEWKEYKLGDFFTVKHGFAFKGKYITTEETSNILVTPGNFNIGGGFKSDKYKYYSGEYPEDYILNEGDIIITMTDLSKETDTLGYSAKVPKSFNGVKYLHNQRIGLVQFKNDNADNDFLYWLMRTREYQGYIIGSASGTSIMHTSPSRIEDFQFLLPPLPEQKAIAEVLSSLDDKIDLLHRQNQTLEQMAETLFRQWFVEEADDSWEEGTLGDICEVIGGFAFKSKDFVSQGVPVIKIKNITNNRVEILNNQFVSPDITSTIDKKYKLKDGDIVMAMTGATIGKIGLISTLDYGLLLLNQRVAVLRSSFQPLLWFLLNSINLEDEILNLSNGAAQANISASGISSISIPKMNEDKIIEFNSIIKSNFDKILENTKQIRTLEKLRDTLLPKLMSGEVRVKM